MLMLDSFIKLHGLAENFCLWIILAANGEGGGQQACVHSGRIRVSSLWYDYSVFLQTSRDYLSNLSPILLERVFCKVRLTAPSTGTNNYCVQKTQLMFFCEGHPTWGKHGNSEQNPSKEMARRITEVMSSQLICIVLIHENKHKLYKNILLLCYFNYFW